MKSTLICLLFLMACSSNAQLNPFSFGPLITANSTSMKSDPNSGTFNPQIGYGFGAFARLKILFLYAEVDLDYMNRQCNNTLESGGSKAETTFNFGGLDATGILGWRVVGIGPLGNFRLFAGYNYNNFSKLDIKVNGSSVSTKNFSTTNAGLVLGTGVDLWRFVFNFKYTIGLSDLNTLSTQELKANTTSLALGFRF
ncbi:MAG TPA: outer membrane beta-barrel protein [Bacteroidia bacterium]|nr:outer membrane beta-barrel protein [Bacteroidia bacterium]